MSALIPHPFTFNAPRSVSGTAIGLPKRELGVHIDAGWVVPANGRGQVTVFAGPSMYRVKQTVVTSITANEIYPYDTATFASATTVESSRSHIGANAGLDVSIRIAKYFGVGAIARYSRATIRLPAPDGSEVTVKAGGLQVGGGVRFRF